MVALRRPPDLPVKKNLSWQQRLAQVAASFSKALGLGAKEEQGYYAKHRYKVLKRDRIESLSNSGGNTANQ